MTTRERLEGLAKRLDARAREEYKLAESLVKYTDMEKFRATAYGKARAYRSTEQSVLRIIRLMDD